MNVYNWFNGKPFVNRTIHPRPFRSQSQVLLTWTRTQTHRFMCKRHIFLFRHSQNLFTDGKVVVCIFYMSVCGWIGKYGYDCETAFSLFSNHQTARKIRIFASVNLYVYMRMKTHTLHWIHEPNSNEFVYNTITRNGMLEMALERYLWLFHRP